MKLPENFCIAPFVQHTTHPSGSCSPCPYLGGTTWPGDSSSIIQQWTGNKLEELREEFLENKKPSICYRCWNEESNGKKSLRLRLFDPVAHTSDYEFATPAVIEQRIANNNYLVGPLVLTIKNGNICNAKCRICHPGDSSRWAADAKKLQELTGKNYYSISQKELNWDDTQLDEIVQLSANLVRLELFGGEPTYNKKVEILLKRLVDLDLAKNITLYFNTNGSINIPEKMPFVKEFKCVELGVSLDGINDKFSYQRHGLNYDEVIDNIQNAKSFFTKHNTKFWIDAISTVSILNVYHLPELKDAITKILPQIPFWNLLIKPDHLYIKNMPDHVKAAVIQKLGDAEDFKELISVMKQPAELEYWDQFLEITKNLDIIRGEDFKVTFPEFAKLI